MNNEAKIIFGIAGVVIGGVLLLMAFAPKDGSSVVSAKSDLVASSSHMTGNINAKVTIVEFGDYQCPACAAFYAMSKDVLDEYTNNPDVNFVYRHYPLPNHRFALVSADAAEAAAEQGKFWDMHNQLYTNQVEWSNSVNPSSLFVKYAEAIGLDVAQFTQALKDKAHRALVEADRRKGDEVGVSWTPSIYVNGVLLRDMPGAQELRDLIDNELAK